MTTTPEPSIFTKIIAREIPATIIYEDDIVIAFFTIEPVNPGHTLVVPKTPFINIFDTESSVIGHMMQVGQKIAQALVNLHIGEGVNIVMNNGKVAGQEVFHAHLHVIPRHKDDNTFTLPGHNLYHEGEEVKIAADLQMALKN